MQDIKNRPPISKSVSPSEENKARKDNPQFIQDQSQKITAMADQWADEDKQEQIATKILEKHQGGNMDEVTPDYDIKKDFRGPGVNLVEQRTLADRAVATGAPEDIDAAKHQSNITAAQLRDEMRVRARDEAGV